MRLPAQHKGDNRPNHLGSAALVGIGASLYSRGPSPKKNDEEQCYYDAAKSFGNCIRSGGTFRGCSREADLDEAMCDAIYGTMSFV